MALFLCTVLVFEQDFAAALFIGSDDCCIEANKYFNSMPHVDPSLTVATMDSSLTVATMNSSLTVTLLL
jgi:hypothetical protein